ncbi:MAG TPA: SLC13 family permease [Desulfobacteraceae bacterium]|nr:SLC13 family permease [Desulfobacteraceae bacterium]
MDLSLLTPDMAVVFGFLILVTLLFILDIFRVDMVGLLLMVLLPLAGVITPAQAVSGLSSNAVVSIIAVIIIGHGLDKTGVMTLFAKGIVRLAGKSRTRVMALISGTVAVLSSFMQNIGAAALFLPATHRMCRQLNVPVSQILIPMSYCAVIGGCITLVGSSPLILLNDLAASWWANNKAAMGDGLYQPFGLFSVAPIGISLVLCAILYFMVFGRYILPKAQVAQDTCCLLDHDLECTYGHEVSSVFELTVPQHFYTRRLEELELRPRYHATVVCISKRNDRYRVRVPGRADVVEPGDVVGIVGNQEHALRLAEDMGWTLAPDLDRLNGVLSPDHSGITEAIVPPRSELVGKTLHEYGFRKKLSLNPLAMYRTGKLILEDISEIKIQPGDAFLLFGEWERFHLAKPKKALAFTQHLEGEVMYPEKAWTAIACLALALILALGFKIQLSVSLLAGAVSMILTRVMDLDEAYQSVDWMTVFLLAGLIPLGVAFESSGAAAFLATAIVQATQGSLTPVLLFLIIGCLTSFFTLVTSNIGATVLMIPLAMNLALQSGADPRMAALLVAVAASNTFVLPTHQVNALVMRPGGYKIRDFIRAGSGMTLIYITVVMVLMVFYYGIAGSS